MKNWIRTWLAPILSQYITRLEGSVTPRSDKRKQIQFSSAAVYAIGLYSTSVDVRATVSCFLEFHEIEFRPR